MTTVICSEPVTIDLELSGAALQVQTDSLVVYTVEWRRWWAGVEAAVPESWPTQPYTFTCGDEVKFQRGRDYFSVWVNGSVMMTVPVDWEADL